MINCQQDIPPPALKMPPPATRIVQSNGSTYYPCCYSTAAYTRNSSKIEEEHAYAEQVQQKAEEGKGQIERRTFKEEGVER
jgi:hypothetical protein